jgi:hypothetical protein
VLTASANHVSLFQLDGVIAPDRSVSTVPPGDHREMSFEGRAENGGLAEQA